MSNVFRPIPSCPLAVSSILKRTRRIEYAASKSRHIASLSSSSVPHKLVRVKDGQPRHQSALSRCSNNRSSSASSSSHRLYHETSSLGSMSLLNRTSAAAATSAVVLVAGTLFAYNNKEKNVTLTEAKSSGSNLNRHPSPTPATVKHENVCEDAKPISSLPVYTAEQVRENDGKDGKPIWMTYGGVVYDVTNFIPNHPGGSEKIMLAAGSAIEPYWHLYRQHFSSDLPTRLMEDMIIGTLDKDEQEEVEDAMGLVSDEYAKEPKRHPSLYEHSDQPMNAESPAKLLTSSYLTPAELFFIRNHHPDPILSEDDLKNYSTKIDLSEYSGKTIDLSLDALKKMKKVEIISTLQCSRNRAGDFNKFRHTSSLDWGQGAISTAKWGGVRLKDVLSHAGLDDPIAAEEKGFEHVCFEGLDGMMSSIRIDKAVSPYGDCILAYEMNGKPLPRDHGFPLRLIVPGYVGVRNVKWVSSIRLSKTESEGVWQHGLNYKILPPSLTDARGIDLEKVPSVNEGSIYSGITKVERCNDPGKSRKAFANAGDIVMVKVCGWAWAGGGRNIVRVDLTGDGGKTWSTAEINQGDNQKFGRAWAWVFWSCELPVTVRNDRTVEVCSKAVDIAFNVQPEACDHTWNVRGLCNNSWFRTTFVVN